MALSLLTVLLAQSTAIVLTDAHPTTNIYRDAGSAVASPDVDTHLEGLLELRKIAPWPESPTHAMRRRQSAQVIDMYEQFNLPCNISTATVTTAVKYVPLFTMPRSWA